MPDTFPISAPAKINLSLRVLGKRDDGFHEIETRMTTLSLADELTLHWTDSNSVELACSDEALPTGEENLVIKAVRALEQHLHRKLSVAVSLEKRIPSGAGLGGGSSDAAATLRALNAMGQFGLSKDDLAGIAAGIGSDVPFFIHGGLCECRGRGEQVAPVPGEHAPLPLFLIKPAFGIPAAWAYQNYQPGAAWPDAPPFIQVGPWGEMVNDLERSVFGKYLILPAMKEWLLSQPEVHAALMSGSGSTMLAVLRHDDDGPALRERALERYGQNCWTWVGSAG